MKYQDATETRSWLTDGKQFALIDVREAGEFGEGHLLHGITMPYSRLELDAPDLITASSAPIRIVDGADGVAERAAERLSAMGYTDVAVIKGGLPACAEAGFTIMKGENVPSKTLGELAEVEAHTPHISAADMMDMIERKEDYILLDGRTPKEFENMSLPTALSCPNAELAFRLPALINDPTKKVIVNCAGRTRSIIGAQSLRNWGFTNPIYALENGTQGWRIAGYDLNLGLKPAPLPDVVGDALEAGLARSKDFMKRYGIPTISVADAAKWIEDETHAVYVFDVRTKEEYAKGHVAGSSHMPGGQLVQKTDRKIAVRCARVILCDDHGLRAANTAYWLRALGFDARILDADVSKPGIELPVRKAAAAIRANALDEIAAADVAKAGGALKLVDLRPSGDYRDGHIDGAVWGIRPRLAALKLGAADDVVLMAEEKVIAEITAADLRDLGVTKIRYLAGDAAAWSKAGLKIVETPDMPSKEERIDFLFFVYDRHLGNLESARRYLAWELGLVEQLSTWERALFKAHTAA